MRSQDGASERVCVSVCVTVRFPDHPLCVEVQGSWVCPCAGLSPRYGSPCLLQASFIRVHTCTHTPVMARRNTVLVVLYLGVSNHFYGLFLMILQEEYLGVGSAVRGVLLGLRVPRPACLQLYAGKYCVCLCPSVRPCARLYGVHLAICVYLGAVSSWPSVCVLVLLSGVSL